MRILFLAVATLFVSWSVTTDESIDGHRVEAWRNHIRPTAEELAWMKIGWLPDLRSGIEAAGKAGKPILLWTMNGHPFGCT